MKIDIQKEREAFQKFCEENFDFERHEQTYFDEQTQCYENDVGEDTESINMAWSAWQARAQAVPDWYVFMPKEPTQEMIEVGMGNFDFPLDNGRFSNHDLIFAYKAMIEAQESTWTN